MYSHLVSTFILKRRPAQTKIRFNSTLKLTENVVKENQDFQIQDWVFDLMNQLGISKFFLFLFFFQKNIGKATLYINTYYKIQNMNNSARSNIYERLTE